MKEIFIKYNPFTLETKIEMDGENLNEKYNFQIQTLNKIITALEVDEKTFFNFEFPEKSKEIENIINQLEQIPEPQKTDIIDAIATLLNNINNR